MTRVKCEICGLTTERKNNKKRTFMAQFPLNENRCRQWVKVTGKEDLAYVPIEKLHQLKQVCEKHFRPKDFQKKKTQLKKNAVPSLGLTAEPLSDEVLKDFPLYIAKNRKNQVRSLLDAEPSGAQCLSNDLFTKISKEHNYCNSNVSETKPSASTQNSSLTLETNVKIERSCSPTCVCHSIFNLSD